MEGSPRARPWLRRLGACCFVEPCTLTCSGPAGKTIQEPQSPLAAAAPPTPATPATAATAVDESRDQLRPLPASFTRKRTSTAASSVMLSARSSTAPSERGSIAAGGRQSSQSGSGVQSSRSSVAGAGYQHSPLSGRSSVASSRQRSGRGSVVGFVTAAVARRSLARQSLARAGGGSLTSAKRSMGSLTAWQVIAAEVQQAMREGAAAAGLLFGQRSTCSELGGTASSGPYRSSQVEHGLGMTRGSRSSHVEPHLVMSEEPSEESTGLPAEDSVGFGSASEAHQQQQQQPLSSSMLGGSTSSAISRSFGSSARFSVISSGSAGGGTELGSSRGSVASASSAGVFGAQAGSSSSSGDAEVGTVLSDVSRFETEFDVLSELGRGAFGCAYKTLRRRDGVPVCIKVLDSEVMCRRERRMSRDEVRVLSAMAHPNIVLYYDCFHERGKQHIVMEFCEEGDLEKQLKSRNGVPMREGEVMLKFVQLCLALQHVHSKGILHRDIKSGNIFCTRHGILKLGDFGISKIMAPGKSHARTMVGTPYCFSPELVEDKPYSKKADVWAAGCVLYELATLQRPFRGSSVSAIAVKILRGTYAPLPEQYSSELHKLVATLLCRKPDRRPSIDEVLGMDYVRFHMRRYRDHVQRTVEHRKLSYFNSLNMFKLEEGNSNSSIGGGGGGGNSSSSGDGSQGAGQARAGGDAAAAALQARQARSPEVRPLLAPLLAAAAPAGYPRPPARRHRLSAATSLHPSPNVPLPATPPSGTVVVKADADQAAQTDLAVALAAAAAAGAAAAAAGGMGAVSTGGNDTKEAITVAPLVDVAAIQAAVQDMAAALPASAWGSAPAGVAEVAAAAALAPEPAAAEPPAAALPVALPAAAAAEVVPAAPPGAPEVPATAEAEAAAAAAAAAGLAAEPAFGGLMQPRQQQQRQQHRTSAAGQPPKVSSFSALLHMQAAAAGIGTAEAAAAPAEPGQGGGNCSRSSEGGGSGDGSASGTRFAGNASAGLGNAGLQQWQRRGEVSPAATLERQREAEPAGMQRAEEHQLLHPLLPLLPTCKLQSISSLNNPESPQSALVFARMGSLLTASSEAAAVSAAVAAHAACSTPRAAASTAPADGGRSSCETPPAGRSLAEADGSETPPTCLPNNAAAEPLWAGPLGADSVIDLERRAPGLMLQMQQLLDKSPHALPLKSSSAGVQSLRPSEEGEEGRRPRRAAVQDVCLEELHGRQQIGLQGPLSAQQRSS